MSLKSLLRWPYSDKNTLKTINSGLKAAKNTLVLSGEFLQTFINLFDIIMVRWLRLAKCEVSPEIAMPVDAGWKW